MPQWYEREAPLALCPLFACRRRQTCLHTRAGDACRRLFARQAEAYNTLARKIEAMRRDVIAKRPPGLVVEVAKEGTPEFERRISRLYTAFRERDEAHAAGQKAERAGNGGSNEKPATTPKGA